jgi:hypothetical protein
MAHGAGRRTEAGRTGGGLVSHTHTAQGTLATDAWRVPHAHTRMTMPLVSAVDTSRRPCECLHACGPFTDGGARANPLILACEEAPRDYATSR